MIIIVEELSIVERGIRGALMQSMPEAVVVACSNLEDIQQKLPGQSPQLIIISLIRHVGGEGVEEIAKARRLFPGSRVVAYGIHLLPYIVRLFYNAGAVGYFSLENNDVSKCVKAALAGKTYFHSELVDAFVSHLQSRSRKPVSPSLTLRQYEVACFLAKGLGNTVIAERLGLTVTTISSVKATIFKKLGIKTANELRAIVKQF